MPTLGTTTAADQVRESLASWLKAFEAKDIETLLSLYDPEAVYANDSAPLMRGLEEIRPWFEGAFESPTSAPLFKEEVLFMGKDLALVVGKFCFKPAEIRGGQETGDEAGRVAIVFRRAEDSRWLLLYDMDNRPPDALPEDFS